MNQVSNWRTETDATDYFGHQKKTLAVADRRPVPRKPSDLVGMGPGIGQAAVRITDFNDSLATYNGYYSAVGGTDNGPTPLADPDDPEEYLVGTVVQDAAFGGVQRFTRLGDGAEYRRIFTRAPYAPETLTWGAWVTL